MPILIDGYNLLYAVGVAGRGHGIGSLERARLGLLHFLLRAIAPDEIAETTVVFDALNAPPGVPHESAYHGLSIRFANRHEYDSADGLIEELIANHPNPKRLTVVSSDHRIQRAAHRRGARSVDSDVWCDELARQRQERANAASRSDNRGQSEKPPLPEEEEIAAWLAFFGGEKATATDLPESSPRFEASQHEPSAAPEAPRNAPPTERKPPPSDADGDKGERFDNPFPPGYAEDLEDDSEA